MAENMWRIHLLQNYEGLCDLQVCNIGEMERKKSIKVISTELSKTKRSHLHCSNLDFEINT